MARRIPSANGVRENGEAPPPSTLAAQIVQNRTRPAATQKNGQAPTFSELLHEILHNHAAAIETDIATNVKLVNVVAEAGLAPLANHDPFLQSDVLIPLAIDSIAVIEATVKRQPGVLFTPVTQDGQPPLLPLLAKLFAVCGRQKCEGLLIGSLLDTMLQGLDTSLELLQNAHTMRQILKDCVLEAISSLEAAITSRSDFSIKVPPARCIATLWPQSVNAIALPHGFQATIVDRAQAFMLVLELCNIPSLPSSWRNEVQTTLQRLAPLLRSQLDRSRQWELASQRLLALPHNMTFLVYVVRMTLKSTPSVNTQKQIAKSLVDILLRDSSLVRDHVLTLLSSMASNDSFDTLHDDLKIAITISIGRLCARENWPSRVLALYDALQQDNVMTDSELQVAFQELSILKLACAHPPRRKRRRIDQNLAGSPHTALIRRTTKLLTGIESEDLNALAEVAPGVYRSLNEDEQCAAWQSLMDLASVELDPTLQTVAKLVTNQELHEGKRPRVLAMLAICKCIQQTTDAKYLDISRSPFGQLALRGLHSSLREIRITSGLCLEHFLSNNLPSELRDGNRKAALDYLHGLSNREVACEQETLVTAWRQVALVCGDHELVLALHGLIGYLGHPNTFICGLAFIELERLADAKSLSMEELLKPFWDTIAFSAVKDLHSRPQKAQQLCDLLHMDINQFLVHTQQYTVPDLVLRKQKDILQRIAGACGHGISIEDLLLQPRTNLMSTLALLLSQPVKDVETSAMACLVDVAPALAGTDIVSLVKIDATLLACNMLKYVGDQEESRRSRAYQAFSVFASIAERRPGQPKHKSSRLVADLLDTHVLGIMTHFSEIIENINGLYTRRERFRCVRAIAEMVILAKKQISVALPQIRATLQSAMEHDGLCEVSFSAWLNLLPVLDSDDIASIVDQTFSLIIRHWSMLSPELRQSTHEKVGNLVKDHNQVLQENLLTLPSLKDIPLLSKFAAEIERLKATESVENHFKAFTRRLRDESDTVVLRALEELPNFLNKHLEFIHNSATTEQPGPALSQLLRALLDATIKYASENERAAELCGQALGVIGCLDPNRIEAARGKRRTLVLSNFDRADEVIDWVIVLLEDILVKAFKSTNNARAQGFLAYVMQELIGFCGFKDAEVLKPRAGPLPSVHQKWMKLPEHVRITLTPFVTSKYVVTSSVATTPPNRAYPAFTPDLGHTSWLRSLVYDLMWKAKGDNPKLVFPLLARTIRGHDLAIASFMLPYAMLNVVLDGTVSEVRGISDELKAVLSCEPASVSQEDTIKLCSESVFSVLDYMSTWLQEKKKALGETKAAAFRTGHSPSDFDEAKDMAQIDTVERFLSTIPADLVATRAVMCGSYARALFNWEQHIRRQRPLIPSSRPPEQYSNDENLYNKLQEIYAQIDEPDGLEGISAHLRFLSDEQQAIQHAKAGRWSAAQAWYELQLSDDPHNVDLEEHLLDCFRETGRYEALLRYADSFVTARSQDVEAQAVVKRLLPSIVQAQWMTSDLDGVKASLIPTIISPQTEFDVGIGSLLAAVMEGDPQIVVGQIKTLRTMVTQSMTVARTSSVHTSRNDLRKLHVLYEIEALATSNSSMIGELGAALDKRLSVIGSYVSDKQYVLGIRRALMQSLDAFGDSEIGSSWLLTAKLARQSGNTEHAYNAVLKAYECGDKGAKIEEARLLWRDGHQRHAIHALESALASGMFEAAVPATDANLAVNESTITTRSTSTTLSAEQANQQNIPSAKVHLLLAKWLDASGQSQVKDLTEKFQYAAKHASRWEKGHYYLGRHYQKVLEAEKALPKERQSPWCQTGELAKLVVENLVRSIPFGNKYWHQTIPKILTLWLDLGLTTLSKPRNEDQQIFDKRVMALQGCNKQLGKYFERVPTFVFYSALPQMISRITHPNPDVWKLLSSTITRIVSTHPSQALWSLFAVAKATDRTRLDRGVEILNRLKNPKAKAKGDSSKIDLGEMIAKGQKLSDGLLRVCEVPIEKKGSEVKLSEDLGFNHRLAPSQLVVPIETTLATGLPSRAGQDTIRRHKAFVQDKVTIHAFAEEVLVLSSLQRPRKLTVRGSDGKQYGLLCKPKDDLRKDRRLMEFNGIINGVLKRDAETSKRQLYVKTYAVTPLSEESGIIEWVEGIKPMRDILLNLYGRRGIRPNYTELKVILDQACAGPEHAHIFVDKILSHYQPVLHEWFTEVYPEPDAWFAARLRYARTAAVMSMAGHVLGLGDRHGENILLEESTGGVFHVDFNCLFDKGRTFDKPEMTPFRLTHNMVDAMGPYGYEGPFRKSSELTMGLLRQSKDTLMTILETFLYDPTTDFIGQKKKKSTPNVPETPQEILDSVDQKLRGLLRGEKVPLGVEGYVDALIREATSPFCLASMYIGWCAFL